MTPYIDFCGETAPLDRQPFTIGRDADLVLDDGNRHLHRHFLSVTQQQGIWLLANVGSQLTAGRQDIGVRLDPAGVRQQPAGSLVDVVPPRREQPDVSPSTDRGGGCVTTFQDGERDAALGKVSGGGQPDGAGADDDDGQVVQAGAH